MQKQTVSFAVEQHNGVVTSIGKSFIETPPIRFNGGAIKWFDDSQLIKKNTNRKGDQHMIIEVLRADNNTVFYKAFTAEEIVSGFKPEFLGHDTIDQAGIIMNNYLPNASEDVQTIIFVDPCKEKLICANYYKEEDEMIYRDMPDFRYTADDYRALYELVTSA